jgi:hypothetical protein
MNWTNILKENNFVIYVKLDTQDDWQKEKITFNTRDEALEDFKKMLKKYNYTVVGNAKEGEAVVMDDGIFVNVTKPTLYYVIQTEDESPPSSNYFPDTKEQYTADAKLRQMEGDYSLSEKW